MNAAQEFDRIIEAFQGKPGVTLGKSFGSPCLKVAGKVFAVLVKAELVVKLPKERVQALITAKVGKPFDPGMGAVMKEWVAFLPCSGDWITFAAESKVFVTPKSVTI